MSAKRDRIVAFVCDDEAIDLSTIRHALERDGRFIVLTCSDYTTGVNVFSVHGRAVDIALLDVALPGKNGVELAQHLLSINPNIKVIFVSGHVGKSVLEHYGVRAADEHFLQKPFNEAALLRRVEQVLATPQTLMFVQSVGGRSEY
jgi:CheY-like chemotaxis protein